MIQDFREETSVLLRQLSSAPKSSIKAQLYQPIPALKEAQRVLGCLDCVCLHHVQDSHDASKRTWLTFSF